MTELSKQQAAEHLGISQRALERYTQQGKVGVKYVKATRGRQARYDLAEVNELKHQLQEPVHRPAIESSLTVLPQSESEQVINIAPSQNLVEAFVDVKQNDILSITKKLLLTIKEAQVLTGLGKVTLRRAIDAGELKAKMIGGSWRIKPDDLKIYINEL